jgi:hypothetical protein
MRPSVYYFYSETDEPLYVGCTMVSVFRRATQHEAIQPWFDEVSTMRFVKFDDHHEAARFEDAEIKRLQPKYNSTQRIVIPDQFPSPKDVTDIQFSEILRLWSGKGKRAEVVREIGDNIMGRVVTDAWVMNLMKFKTGSAARNQDNYKTMLKRWGKK